jgi:hypothetical protein
MLAQIVNAQFSSLFHEHLDQHSYHDFLNDWDKRSTIFFLEIHLFNKEVLPFLRSFIILFSDYFFRTEGHELLEAYNHDIRVEDDLLFFFSPLPILIGFRLHWGFSCSIPRNSGDLDFTLRDILIFLLLK